MTVVEREVVVTERERRARVLEAAALEIDFRGWTRGFACNSEGHVCAGGAIALALGFDVKDESLGQLWKNVYAAFGDRGVPSWNDNRAASAADVKFVLRWRAEEIRDGR